MTNPSPPTSREQEALSLLEAAAKLEGWVTINPEAPCWKASVAAIIAAVDAERERAARVAEDEGSDLNWHQMYRMGCNKAAQRIRNPEGETL